MRTIETDVVIVGAGISGINVAHRVAEQCPELSYVLLEGRDEIGGTWDLFRYPGIRSDSDFYTLAFPFHPWRGENSIVGGEQIMDYLHETVRRSGIDEHVRLGTRVQSADFSTETARWTLQASERGEPVTYVARFVALCTGYYDYDHPHDPAIPGTDEFAGQVVHPQFWPTDLDVTGRRIAVIGSGATAITLVPALAEAGAEVTMVQRTPTYVLAQPRNDVVGDALRKVLPADTAHRIMRVKNTALQWALYQACRRAPGTMRTLLRKGAVDAVGSEDLVDAHFNPPYEPWDQRLCIAPEGDFYAAVRRGEAQVVTGTIERLEPDGVRMADGTLVEADVVVTATGLRIKLLGGIEGSVDGVRVEPGEGYAYLGAMLSGVPNLAFCVGYINLSWTMRSDMTARLVARVLRRMLDTGVDQVVPVAPADLGPSHPLMDMPSGYLARAADQMPRTTDTYPWAMTQNVVKDAWGTNRADLDDGLVWSRVPTARPREVQA